MVVMERVMLDLTTRIMDDLVRICACGSYALIYQCKKVKTAVTGDGGKPCEGLERK